MADPWDEIQTSASFDGGDLALALRLPRQIMEALKGLLSQIIGRPPPPPPSGPTPDQMAAIQRILHEQLKQQQEVIMERFGFLLKRVNRAVETSVRNESHLRRVEGTMETFEKTLHESAQNTKESLSAEMKEQFNRQMRQFNSVHKKSVIQEIDAVLKDIETAEGFPARIGKLAERIFYHLIALQTMYNCACYASDELQEVSSEIKQLPERFQQLNWQNAKFTDFSGEKTSLLRSYFHTGDVSRFHLDYSLDVSGMMTRLLSGDGGQFSIDTSDFSGFWYLQLKTHVTNDDRAVVAKLKFPGLYFGGLKGSISVPLPFTNIMGNVHLLHEYGALHASVQAGASPLVTMSGVFGLKAYAVGADIGFNPMSWEWTKYNAAARFSTDSVDVSVITANLTDTVRASATYKWGAYTAGVETSFTFSNKLSESFVGLSHRLDLATLLKVRLGLRGRVSQGNDKLLERRAVGGISLLRSWGRCAAGLSMEVDLHERNAPRFGAFLKFGDVKSEPRPVKSNAFPVKAVDFALVQ